MKVTIHRGTHEIGGSCVEVADNGTRIVIDLGIPLVKPGGEKFNINDYKHLKGAELVEAKILPAIQGLYKWDSEVQAVDGLLISHAHLDHSGFLEHIRNDIPIYLSQGTKRLLDLNKIFLNSRCDITKPFYLYDEKPVNIGSFIITPYLVDHSAFDAQAFLIEAGKKRLFYSGDFRGHGRKRKKFYYFLNNCPSNIDALLLEGSLMGRKEEIQKTEEDIEKDIINTIKKTDNIVLSIFSAQNIDRLVSFYRAAKKTGRLFVIDVYTANVIDALSDLFHFPSLSDEDSNIKVFFPRRLCDKLKRTGHQELMYKFKKQKITTQQISDNLRNIVMIVRPTMLDLLTKIKGLNGATVIYSMWKGYLDDASMVNFNQFMNEYAMSMVYIHTSGHASINTLKKTVERLKPTVIIPMHTFYPKEYKLIFPNVTELTDGVEFNI